MSFNKSSSPLTFCKLSTRFASECILFWSKFCLFLVKYKRHTSPPSPSHWLSSPFCFWFLNQTQQFPESGTSSCCNDRWGFFQGKNREILNSWWARRSFQCPSELNTLAQRKCISLLCSQTNVIVDPFERSISILAADLNIGCVILPHRLVTLGMNNVVCVSITRFTIIIWSDISWLLETN